MVKVNLKERKEKTKVNKKEKEEKTPVKSDIPV
jgi:hypothetical protein